MSVLHLRWTLLSVKSVLDASTQAAVTKHAKPGAFTTETVPCRSGGLESKTGVPASPGSGEHCLLGLRTATFLLCPHMAEHEGEKEEAERGRAFSGVSL